MASVQDSWRRIEAWLKDNVETLSQALIGPADEAAIANSESAIGFQFPEDLRNSYLIQNGVEYGESELNLFPTVPDAFDDMAFCLLPIEAIAEEWKIWQELIDGGDFDDAEAEPDDGIQDVWWSKGWIPVAGNGGGDFICVDMDPGEGGTAGQVICAWHDMDERKLIAASWGAYLESLAAEMERGDLTYSEDEGLIRE